MSFIIERVNRGPRRLKVAPNKWILSAKSTCHTTPFYEMLQCLTTDNQVDLLLHPQPRKGDITPKTIPCSDAGTLTLQEQDKSVDIEEVLVVGNDHYYANVLSYSKLKDNWDMVLPDQGKAGYMSKDGLCYSITLEDGHPVVDFGSAIPTGIHYMPYKSFGAGSWKVITTKEREFALTPDASHHVTRFNNLSESSLVKREVEFSRDAPPSSYLPFKTSAIGTMILGNQDKDHTNLEFQDVYFASEFSHNALSLPRLSNEGWKGDMPDDGTSPWILRKEDEQMTAVLNEDEQYTVTFEKPRDEEAEFEDVLSVNV